MNVQSMKEWLTTGYDLCKQIIVFVGLLGILLFGLFLYQFSEDRKLTAALNSAEQDFKSLYKTASEIGEINKQLKEDGLASETTSLNTYLQTQAYNAQLGDLGKTDQQVKTGLSKGYEDQIVNLDFKGKDRTFNRGQISRFLWAVESNSPRVRVTGIKMDPPRENNRSTTGQKREDEWVFSAEVTYRRRVEKKP